MNFSRYLDGMFLTVVGLMALASVAAAHEGQVHVMGTVAEVDAGHIVVTDQKSHRVSITTTPETKFSKGDAPSSLEAVKVGARVVVDVVGEPSAYIASGVRLARTIHGPQRILR